MVKGDWEYRTPPLATTEDDPWADWGYWTAAKASQEYWGKLNAVDSIMARKRKAWMKAGRQTHKEFLLAYCACGREHDHV